MNEREHQTRQVVFASVGDVRVDSQPIPELGAEDVLVRIALVGVCATDLHLLAGHIGEPFPLVPGHEFVGEVAALGVRAVEERGLAVGDHVAVEMLLPCRACMRCREGRSAHTDSCDHILTTSETERCDLPAGIVIDERQIVSDLVSVGRAQNP